MVVFEEFINMNRKARFERTAHKPKSNINIRENIPKGIVDNDRDSQLFKEKASEGLNRSHELKELDAEISSGGSKMLSGISLRPINDLLQVPIPNEKLKVLPVLTIPPVDKRLEPSKGSTKEQNAKMDKSLRKVQVKTNGSTKKNRIDVSNLQVKIKRDLVKNEAMVTNSKNNVESSLSENKAVEVHNLQDLVILLEDSEDENMNVEETDGSQDEILLDDSVVDRMDLNQEVDVNYQFEQNALKNSKTIFIGNLPRSMKKLHVFKFFERFGNITDLKYIHSKDHKKIICFITYKDSKSVDIALEANGLLYCGHNFRVARIGRRPVIVDSTIVVTNLPNETSYQDLYCAFEVCGLIKSQYLTKENGKLLAYITYELQVSAAYAVLLQSFFLKGCQLNVQQYTNQREEQGLSNFIT